MESREDRTPGLPRNPYIEQLDIVREESRPDYVRISKIIKAEDLNTLGLAHGGLAFSLADEACGTVLDVRGIPSVTLNADYHFLRSAKVGDRLIAEAWETEPGAPICVMRASVTDQNGTMLGTGTFTLCMLR